MAGTRSAGGYSVAVFPFLKTTGQVEIGDLIFRSTEDVAGLGTAEAESVLEVAGMLFLQDDLRIRSASYSIVPFVDLDRPDAALEKLKRVQTVIAYGYAIPHHRLFFGCPKGAKCMEKKWLSPSQKKGSCDSR